MSNSGEDTWRQEVKQLLTKAADSIDDFVDARVRNLRRHLGAEGIPQIQPYIGYANEEKVWLHGRVLTNPISPWTAEMDDGLPDRLASMYQRFASDEVPNVRVRAQYGDSIHFTETDAEGYFHIRAPHGLAERTDRLWCKAMLQIVDHPKVPTEQSLASVDVLMPPSAATFGVISDVDDTVMHTGATQLLTMLRLTLLGTARTRKPLPGVAALYRALVRAGNAPGKQNPLFYVSSSPWNLYDLLLDFFDLNDLPRGPILLRDFGVDEEKLVASGHDHKLRKIRNLLTVFPKLAFVLVGDSGQEDAELYAAAAEEFGSRIIASFIRDVDPDRASQRDQAVAASIARSSDAGVPMHLVRDSVEIANVTAELDLIEANQIEPIRAETHQDEERSRAILPVEKER